MDHRMGCLTYRFFFEDTHDDETIEKVESPDVNIDPIVSLLSQHPLNTTLDASEPLTEEELMGR